MATLHETARTLDITPRRVQQLVGDGIIPRPEKGEYDLIRCVIGYIRYLRKLAQGTGDLSLTDARTRVAKEQADKMEMENRKSRGELVPLAIMGKVIERLHVNFRGRLVTLPGRLAPQIVGSSSIQEVKALLDEGIYEALDEMARVDPDIVARESVEGYSVVDPDTPAPAEIDGESMG